MRFDMQLRMSKLLAPTDIERIADAAGTTIAKICRDARVARPFHRASIAPRRSTSRLTSTSMRARSQPHSGAATLATATFTTT